MRLVFAASEFLQRRSPELIISLAVVALSIGPAYADVALNIIPTFDSSITADPNAASIEGTINTAINFYQTTLTTHTVTPIDVTIDFKEMSSGLGQETTTLFKVPYLGFNTALHAASSGDATDATALSLLPIAATNNPVTGSSNINVKTAQLRALGYTGLLPVGGFDGTVGLNTSITTPGSPGSALQFSLFSVTEHEINEVLGLGSDLGGTGFFSDPAPEDLFRYSSTPGVRSYATSPTASAFLSIDGSTHLAQFNNNQNNGGDLGDWAPGGQPQVQDAFATPGANPSLTVNSPEVIALDAMGYNLAEGPSSVPEPSTLALFATGLLGFVGVCRRVQPRRKN